MAHATNDIEAVQDGHVVRSGVFGGYDHLGSADDLFYDLYPPHV